MAGGNEIIKRAEAYARQFYKEKIPKEFRFHSLTHTEEVAATARELGTSFQLPKEELKDLTIATWFHDLGFYGGVDRHEERSAELAEKFLSENQYPAEHIHKVVECIKATGNGQVPSSEIGKIIKDADTSHVGKKEYFSKLPLLKTEWEVTQNRHFDEKQWLELNLSFLNNHKFYSAVGEQTFSDRKRKNILKLQSQLSSLLEFQQEVVPLEENDEDISSHMPKKKPDRGIETMFRVTLRNHNQISRIADNKAGIMLSVNAIMLSIVVSSLAPKLDSNPRLIVPTVILILMCMLTVVFATLATRPKITSAEYSDQKFLDKKFNMLFFGNFYKLPLDKFEWGMDKLMKNEDLLYSSLSKDLYFLGIVLAKKYRYLRICYNIFVFGLVITAISFILVLI